MKAMDVESLALAAAGVNQGRRQGFGPSTYACGAAPSRGLSIRRKASLTSPVERRSVAARVRDLFRDLGLRRRSHS